MEEKKKDRKKIFLVVILTLVLMLLVVGVSYAVFTYTKLSDDNRVTIGQIAMSYEESSTIISVEDAMPMTDTIGRSQTDYFNFSVTSRATTNENDDIGVALSYEISLTSLTIDEDKQEIPENYIKLYLTKVENTKETKLVEDFLDNFGTSSFGGSAKAIHNQINVHRNGNDEITTKYRLRAWISTSVEIPESFLASKHQFKFAVNINSTSEAVNGLNKNIVLNQPSHGTIKVTNKMTNKVYTTNLVAKKGDELLVTAESNDEKWKLGKIYNNGKEVVDNTITVGYEDINIKATFTATSCLRNNWLSGDRRLDKTFEILIMSDTKEMPETYEYEGVTYTKQDVRDVSNQGNMEVMFGWYYDESSNTHLGIIGQNGGVVSPVVCRNLFGPDNFNHPLYLKKIILDNFDTSQVVSMANMFSCCYGLQTLDLSNFDTSQVTDMSGMFSACSNLTNIIFSENFGSAAENMANMFFGCSGLQTLDLSNFDTSQVTNMEGMFSYCNRLQTLDLSNFDTSHVGFMSRMFCDCSLLTSVTVGCNWKTASNTTDWFTGTQANDVTKVCNE